MIVKRSATRGPVPPMTQRAVWTGRIMLEWLRVRVALHHGSLDQAVGRLGPTDPFLPNPRWISQLITRRLTLGPVANPRCLVRALVLARLLRRQGQAAALVIGLPVDARDKDAHAWVLLDGEDIGPAPGGAGFIELARYPSTMERRRDQRPRRTGDAASRGLGTLMVVALVLPLAGASVRPGPLPSASSRTPAWFRQARVALSWAPAFMSSDHHFSRRQALAAARRFDLVAALPTAFAHDVRAMRGTNPHLILLAYSNAMLTSPRTAAGLGAGKFAHDQSGRRIRSAGFGQYLMEPSASGWRRSSVRGCAERVAESGYNGCLLDMLTLGVFAPGYLSALPVVPGTHTPYTQRQWRRQLLGLAHRFAQNRPRLTFAANAVGNAYRYWEAPVSSRPIVRALPAAMMEDFLRGATDPVAAFPTGREWRRNLAVIRDFESHARTGLFVTKLWVTATPHLVRQWEAYCFATFLLAANGHTYIGFTRSRDRAGALGLDLPFQLPRRIGTPRSGAREIGGTFRRSFSRGLVIVNPTMQARSIRLHRAYRRLDGSVERSADLAAHSGEVLVSTRQRGGAR